MQKESRIFMTIAKLLRRVAIIGFLILAAIGIACVRGPAEKGKTATGKIRIGLSLDTLKEERWQRDRDLFVARAQELGAEVLVQSASGNDNVQTQQAENLLTQGVNV